MMHSDTILEAMTTRVSLSCWQKSLEKNATSFPCLFRSEIGQGTTVTMTVPAIRRDPGSVKEET